MDNQPRQPVSQSPVSQNQVTVSQPAQPIIQQNTAQSGFNYATHFAL